MTVIAYDGRYVAADRQATTNGMPRAMCKLFIHGGKVLAMNGSAGAGVAMVAWFKSGCTPGNFPPRVGDEYAYLEVFEKGKHVIRYESYPVPVVFTGAFYAAGTGRDLATAALHCGKSAREAVEIASLYDIHCGMGVDVIDLWEIASDQDDGRTNASPRRASRTPMVGV